MTAHQDHDWNQKERIGSDEPSPPCPVCGGGHIRIPEHLFDAFTRLWWEYERYEQDEDDGRFPAFIGAEMYEHLDSWWGLDPGAFVPYRNVPTSPLVEVHASGGLEARIRAVAAEEDRTIEDVTAEAAWYAMQAAAARHDEMPPADWSPGSAGRAG